MQKFDLGALLFSLMFDESKRERVSTLIPEILDKISADLEIPFIYMDYCKIESVENTEVTYVKTEVAEEDMTYQEILLSLLIVFEDSKLIDIKGTLQDYIMERIS